MDGYIVSVPGYICFGIVAHGFWHVEQVRQIARIARLIGDSDVLDRRGGAASGIDDLPGDEKSGSIVPVGVGFEIPLVIPAVFEFRVWIDNWNVRVRLQVIEKFTAAGRSVRCGEAIREEFAVYTFFVGRTQEDKFSSLFFPGIVNGLEFFGQHTKFPGGKTVGAEEVLDRASERVKVPAIFSGDDVLRVSELE